MRAFCTLSMLWLAATAVRAEDPLAVVAASRAGRIEFFDSSLNALAAISVGQSVESVAAGPDGRRLYLALGGESATSSCCGLYALDLGTRTMCFLPAPALFGVPSPDGRFLFTQGAGGVDVFDAATLFRLPRMKAPGTYNLQPSPDGRWLLGVTNYPQASVDVFDMKARAMVRRLPVPVPGPAAGAWAGDRFYVFAYDANSAPGSSWLWNVNPERSEPPPAEPIGLLDLHGACNQPVLLMLAGAPGRLFIAEVFGFKVDRRRDCPDQASSGVYAIRPSSGRVDLIAPSVQVNRMVVSPDGRDLYVIHSSAPGPQRNVSLLRFDTRTSRILSHFILEPGDWNLALARIPPGLIPRGEVRAAGACPR